MTDDPKSVSQITLRSLAVGLFIGSLLLFTNFRFGLQTGWVSMMSLPSALLGFVIFRVFQSSKSANLLTPQENVFVQSVAVAVGTGPLAFGLIGVVPAIEKLLRKEEVGDLIPFPINLSFAQLVVWSMGLAFFGVFFAALLRKQVIEKEQLQFPSGEAAGTLISVLHSTNTKIPHTTEEQAEIQTQTDPFRKHTINLSWSFAVASFYTFMSYFLPILQSIPILGTGTAQKYHWTFQPSPAYIGQGAIMGLPTVSSMLLGAFLSWGLLAPLANHMGWASGPVDDWKTGAQGWVLWVSLAIMMADTLVSFVVAVLRISGVLRDLEGHLELAQDEHHAIEPSSQPDKFSCYMIPGLVVAVVVCIFSIHYLFGNLVPLYASIFASGLALILSILGVRALGETDLNPVSGIGKLSQLVFAVIVPPDHPGSVLINLIAGAVAEAGAQQAGDLMQDLKTGHLLGADPQAQLVAQLVGSMYSVFLSAAVYKLYNRAYEIPGPTLRVPTAVVWMDCARLVTGGRLPPMAKPFAFGFASLFAVLSFIKQVYGGSQARPRPWTRLIPSGVAVGVGMYNTPPFTVARFIGGSLASLWTIRHPTPGDRVILIILASGLILGEGVFSIVTLFLSLSNQ